VIEGYRVNSICICVLEYWDTRPKGNRCDFVPPTYSRLDTDGTSWLALFEKVHEATGRLANHLGFGGLHLSFPYHRLPLDRNGEVRS
jgi:hypothetical protein